MFFELVVAHGVLELSCITVAGAAGLRLGWSIVDPGLRTRMASLGAEARRCVAIVFGTMPWLVVAGLTEGFITGSGISLAAVLAVGLGLGAAPTGRWCSGAACCYSRPCDFARRYDLTHAAGSAAAGASITSAPARRRSAIVRRARGEHVERDGGPVDVDPLRRLRARRARCELDIGDGGNRDRVAAGQHRQRVEQRLRGGLVEHVGQHEHERALRSLHPAERALVVAVDGARLEVEERPDDRVGAAPARARACAAGRRRTRASPQRSPSSSATAATATAASIAASSRVPEPAGAAISRPQSTTQTTSRSRSTRYWLLIGRPSRAAARQFTWRMSSSGR